MASVPEQLLEAVDELDNDKPKRQKSAITADELEKADAVDGLMQTITLSHTAVSVDLNAKTGAIVNSPILTGNIIQGPVIFSFNSTTGAVEPQNGTEGQTSEKQEDNVLQKILKKHKDNMKAKTERVFEGKKDNKIHLNKVYTELFITEGDISDVYDEHEVLKIDRVLKTPKFEDTPINCNEIFCLLRQKEEGNIVLTKGIAGIGKTFSVHKFILDWAEGKANLDVDCVFLLAFREINLINDGKEVSLHELLLEFYPELNDVENTKFYKKCNLAFIFDGLDESRLELNFNCKPVKCVNERSSADALFTSLVKGKLLPSALVWVTSRPAAANQIPPEYVGLFTEVRGFTDQQKEEYFRKRIKDETQASKVICHIRTSRSLYIMCHIPVFCWITATVLQDVLIKNNGQDIPSTLTEMYIHFLLIQMNIKNQKYEEKLERDRTKVLVSNKEIISKLAMLAFEQLKKENVMFYEKDLKACGINASEESTGLCTEIFKKDSVLHEMKVYYFIHLSVQEFLAALHVFLCYLKQDMDELAFFLENARPKKDQMLYILLKKAIDKAKMSERGHFDLFLRFLLGISLESNQRLLIGLLDETLDSRKCINKTIQYIKELQNNDKCPDKSINHFFCILELQDRTLYQQIMKYLRSESGQPKMVSKSNCSALVYVLLMSEEVLEDFNPKAFNNTYPGCRRLVPAVRCCRKALFSDCGLTETCCETVASALQLEDCPLRELDLSHNYSIEAGVNALSAGLKSPHCHLETLRLAQCHFGQDCCMKLVSAIQTISHRLKELDLSGSDLQNSGLHHLLDGMENTERKLQVLRLSWCNLTEKSCEHLLLILSSDLPLKELDLSNNDLQDSGVRLLYNGLKSPNCQLEILRLSGCMLTEEGCGYVSSALSSNPSHLRELDLSYNHPGQSGVQPLNDKLRDPNYSLQILKTDPMGEHFIKPGIRKYACDLTLDPNTAHVQLCLSNGDRTATQVMQIQPYPDHPERFEPVQQVLSRESLSGRCYWEAEWTGPEGTVGVTYKNIQRKNDDLCLVEATGQLGNNDVSWKITCGSFPYVSHATEDINIKTPTSRSCNRVGVYVDTTAGVLSFYSVSDTLSHLYTFLASFKYPLYAAFKVESDSVSFCQML
ncbi:NACHT, LRR and PYD domains-containing protein 12 [Ctenopharyngodon idella]|uniref:NACHT, LRR and PYD domains-containing protein 12 n=1 Tax=Ctenopharyngodon idella TaxID=7959 RepID=UPI002230C2A1|nr:NACHT, LRR and PYD domains-containing protein 12 [Ctenopharyngodon idella]XP_051733035.1 NACHT, LRR and PYD domains-containing protein 12 [Ctenopharyngodon idella]XP_051733122.1 NACHT, LRR and PYD domains-containing protein 12 [Ctenopharyngodon idella]XP_051733208.1 NACHT, LRR and PYD domains-containing protein 12 [Ctenopharyngodon idella]